MSKKMLISGNEAIALAACDCHVALGCGYPGTPSSEILDNFSLAGGRAQWSPNEKVALEVAIGAAFTGARSLVTMKHVGMNVAADPLFTIAYSGTPGGLVIVSADDPGMASSQNEQDNRRYAVASGAAMLEPSDSQEAYDFTVRAFEISEKYRVPVILRVTTRVCHSKTLVERRTFPAAPAIEYVKDVKANVMIPAYARIAHKRMRQALKNIQADEAEKFAVELDKSTEFGIVTSGISFMHSLEAAPEASILKLGMTHPLPIEKIRRFAAKFSRCLVVEEGDSYLFENCMSNGIKVENKLETFRYGELNVGRVRYLIEKSGADEAPGRPGKPPQLCVGCPHRKSYEAMRDLNLIVAGDIGCYTLGVLPPFEAVDTCVCMGASITTGLGMRKVLPEPEARRVVSVIGDSTFWHTGINGIVEMVYNRPKFGHVVIVLDNSTTAMTGLQEHAGTGFHLDNTPSDKLVIEDVVKSMKVDNVDVIDSTVAFDQFKELLEKRLASNDLSVIIARRPCILEMAKRSKRK